VRAGLSERVEAARRELAAISPGEWRAGSIEETSEGRAVVELRLGGQRVIGKLRSDGDGEATFRLLQALEASGTETLRVPHPIAWCAGPRALLGAPAAGEACRALNPTHARATLERIGRALRELHALELPAGSRKSLADHVAELIRPAPSALAEAYPGHAGRIRATLERLHAAEATWGRIADVPIHRDFHLRQLFDDGRHITVLDWDDAATGDPAFDVGYFTAYLRTHHAAADAEAGIAAFRAGYGGDDVVWARVPVYERFNYLRRAARRLRLRDARWEQELAAMMARLDD